MKKLIFPSALFFFTLLLYSCKKNSNNEKSQSLNGPIENIVSFKDLQEYFKTLDLLDKMSQVDLMKWKSKNNSNSFFDYLDSRPKNLEIIDPDSSGLSELPTSYQVILNKNGQVKIGDTVICYYKGVKHHVPYSEIRNFDLKQENENSKYRTSTYDVLHENSISPKYGISNRINMGVDQKDARYQWAFNQQSSTQGSGCRKFVNELTSVRDQWTFANDPSCGGLYTYRVGIYYVLKMEWRNCRKNNWQTAGEMRNIRWNLDLTISLRGVSLPCSSLPEIIYSFTGNTTSPPWRAPMIEEGHYVNYNYWINLAYASGNTKSSATNLFWELDLSGFAYQRVIDDIPTNAWTNSGYPLY